MVIRWMNPYSVQKVLNIYSMIDHRINVNIRCIRVYIFRYITIWQYVYNNNNSVCIYSLCHFTSVESGKMFKCIITCSIKVPCIRSNLIDKNFTFPSNNSTNDQTNLLNLPVVSVFFLSWHDVLSCRALTMNNIEKPFLALTLVLRVLRKKW